MEENVPDPPYRKAKHGQSNGAKNACWNRFVALSYAKGKRKRSNYFFFFFFFFFFTPASEQKTE